MTERWIDYSGLRPDPHLVKAHGATGVLRYLSEPISATAWKRITVAEKDAILAAGLDLILNFEWYEGRCLEGWAAGVHDGKVAADQARTLGYPKGASIYFSHDTAARNDAAVIAYLRGAQVSLGSDFLTDIYSGFDVVELALRTGVANHGWQTLAWSSGRIGAAKIYQNGNQWYNGGADENVIRGDRPLGSWRDHASVITPRPPVIKPPIVPVGGDVTYVVKPGDNLTTIAARFPEAAITAASIAALNHLPNGNVLSVGQLLVIQHGSKTKPAPKPAPKPTPRKPTRGLHTVVAGDSLGRIAVRYRTTVAELLALNPLLKPNPNLIHVGWQLIVPLGSAPKPVIKKPTPAKTVVPKMYRIVPGDTLGAIALKHGTTVAKLLSWNWSIVHNPNLIQVGWVIRVG